MQTLSSTTLRLWLTAALADRDTRLLRNIAAGQKGLSNQQRQALLLMADIFDRAAGREGRHA
jgi:hypothetical protein